MTTALASSSNIQISVRISVCGIVQGVGFRPYIWRLASGCNLRGEVYNDATGVLIKAAGYRSDIEQFLNKLKLEIPPLSRIDKIECQDTNEDIKLNSFEITQSSDGNESPHVTADAALCSACLDETLSPFERRFRYPFTNCTHCGPRFSIVKKAPYDRTNTSMAAFDLCDDCNTEFSNTEDRRFHAQPIACHACGPKATLVHLNEGIVTYDMHSMLDDVDAVCSLLQKGEIVAIRGIGGFHLACDATNPDVVAKLRIRKQRDEKPFALMARDLDIVRQYADVSELEQQLLESPEAPIVLLKPHERNSLPDELAPGLNTLGFMLPYTPMHVLMLRRMTRPVVMTSANLSNAPQVKSNEEVSEKLTGIADYALFHDRDIVNRVDDSVVRVMGGRARIMRRSRGYAPGAIKLPEGFENAPNLLAYGGELKSTFCLVKSGAAILSQHQGDLENVETYEEYQSSLNLFQDLYEFKPELLAGDMHPEYLSTKLANDRAQSEELPITFVQHHHAHIDSCMAENHVPLGAKAVLGVALDGLGFGDDGEIWGGEFMLANYDGYKRLGTFKPVAMIGGAQAIKEPWRNVYAHLLAEMGWDRFEMNFTELDLYNSLEEKSLNTIDQMLKNNTNVPLASSCGRLFDAVAAATGLCFDSAAYEGQGAMLLEAAIDEDALNATGEESAYPFAIPNLQSNSLPYIEPLAMWQALLGDLILKTPIAIIAARFHNGLARIIADMISRNVNTCSIEGNDISQVVLTGGCFQNSTLLELILKRLADHELEVLTHSKIPSNDGGLALGQAVIAAAKILKNRS